MKNELRDSKIRAGMMSKNLFTGQMKNEAKAINKS